MTTAPAAVVEETPAVETPEVDPFTAAFEQMALNEADEPASGTEPKPAEPAPAPVEPAAVEEPAAPANPEVPAAPVEPAATPEPVVASKEEENALLARLAKLVKDDATPQPQQPAPQQTQQQATPQFTEEEVKLLEDYAKDWPDVARAETLRRKAEYQQLVGYVFQQVQAQYQPYVDMVQQLADHVQLQQLQTTVPDYNDVREQVVDWVNKQPTYLQVAYKHVINNGTVDEVSDLITRFKSETGVSPAAQAAPAPAAKKQVTELPPVAKQAAAALAPVSSKRTAVPQGEPTSFEDAFAMFSAKGF